MKSFLLGTLCASLFAFTSCQSDDVIPQDRIEGTWNVQKVETESQFQDEQPTKETESFEGQNAKLTFLASGNFEAENFLVPLEIGSDDPISVDGTYKIDGNEITLTFVDPEEGSDVKLVFTTDVNRNTMTLKMNKDQLFVTLDALASTDPFLGLFLEAYKAAVLQFNLTYTLTKA